MFRGDKRFHSLLFIENFQHFLQLYQIVFLYYRTSNAMLNFVHGKCVEIYKKNKHTWFSYLLSAGELNWN